MQKIEVKIPANPQSSYAITVGDDFLDSIIPQIKTLLPNRELFIITDANVVKAGLLEKLTAGCKLPCYVISPAGELSLTYQTFGPAVSAAMAAAMLSL